MTFDANLWDALIVRIEVSDRGDLLWEFRGIHRARFFDLLIIRIEVSTQGHVL